MWLITRYNRKGSEILDATCHGGFKIIEKNESFDCSNRTTPIADDDDASVASIRSAHPSVEDHLPSQHPRLDHDSEVVGDVRNIDSTSLDTEAPRSVAFTSSTSEQPLVSSKSRVRFSTIEVREYARCATDNPSVASGVPVGLDWTIVTQHETLPVEDYEVQRSNQQLLPRSSSELRLTPMEREELLRAHCGYSRADLKDLEYRVNVARRQRQATIDGFHREMNRHALFKRLQYRKFY
jgi:hypothetical protein